MRKAADRDHRLRKHPDYQRAYKAAERKQWARQIAWFSAVREPGSVAAQRSATTGPRIGLTVPKALGKAVDRNRIKRRLREIIRQTLPALGGLPVDVILHPKRGVLDENFAVLQREVLGIFRSVRARAAKRDGIDVPNGARNGSSSAQKGEPPASPAGSTAGPPV